MELESCSEKELIDLHIESIWKFGRSLEKVVGAPSQCLTCLRQLLGHSLPEFKHAPCQHRGCKGHGQAKLDVVASVIVATGQIRLQQW